MAARWPRFFVLRPRPPSSSFAGCLGALHSSSSSSSSSFERLNDFHDCSVHLAGTRRCENRAASGGKRKIETREGKRVARSEDKRRQRDDGRDNDGTDRARFIGCGRDARAMRRRFQG